MELFEKYLVVTFSRSDMFFPCFQMVFFSIVLVTFFVASCMIQNEIEIPLYLGQTPPGLEPEIFAPGLVSIDSVYEFGSVFNKAGNEFFYGVELGHRTETRRIQADRRGGWKDEIIVEHPVFGYNDPMLSPDEKRLYYISNESTDGSEEQKDHDFWYSELSDDGVWSKPINTGSPINTEWNEYYMSFTADGSMYFGSNRGAEDKRSRRYYDLYRSQWGPNGFEEPVALSDSVNSKWYEADVFVAPDESYIIFCSARPKSEGLGFGDLYISFRDENGAWTRAKNMGAPINTEGHELCPFVTVDGKYLFYTSRKDIYWVSTRIFDRYR